MTQEPSATLAGMKLAPSMTKDVIAWDADHVRYDGGERRDIVVAMPLYRYYWTNIGAQCVNEPPAIDWILDVEFCESIYILCSTIHPLTVGTNTDFNVHTSPDRENWDTVPFATLNLGANAAQAMLVAPGMKWIRMRLDNNDGGAVTAFAIVKRLK